MVVVLFEVVTLTIIIMVSLHRIGEWCGAPLPPPRPPPPPPPLPAPRHPEQPSTPHFHADDHFILDEQFDAVGPLGSSGTPPGIEQKPSVSVVDAHDTPVGVPPSETAAGTFQLVLCCLEDAVSMLLYCACACGWLNHKSYILYSFRSDFSHAHVRFG